MRPTVPTPAQVPFEVPDSVRLIDPTLPEGATLIPPPPAGWFDPDGVAIPEILNHYVNFGWEYVWHCHILSHEEMDMMHSLVFAVPPKAPTGLGAAWNGHREQPERHLDLDGQLHERDGVHRPEGNRCQLHDGTDDIQRRRQPPARDTVTYTDTHRREQFDVLVQGVRNRHCGRRHSGLRGFTRLPHHVRRLCFQHASRSRSGPHRRCRQLRPT